MGVSFSDNGKYIGWSPLFDITSYKTLKASEKLPVPNKTLYLQGTENAINVEQEANNIAQAEAALAENNTEENRVNKINAYVALFDKLEDHYGRVTLDFGNAKNARQVIRTLNRHSFYLEGNTNTDAILKNSVQYYISEIIQNLRNMDMAYSPISMDAMQKGAEKETKVMSLMNPLTKFSMQIENMTGKDCIGISAVGEKAYFGLSYYWNEGIRSNDPNWQRELRFEQVFTRLSKSLSFEEVSRNPDDKNIIVYYKVIRNGVPVLLHGSYQDYINSQDSTKEFIEGKRRIVRTTLANANFESNRDLLYDFLKVDDQIRSNDPNAVDRVKQLRDYIRQLHNNDVYADELISQLLSAATDFHIL